MEETALLPPAYIQWIITSKVIDIRMMIEVIKYWSATTVTTTARLLLQQLLIPLVVVLLIPLVVVLLLLLLLLLLRYIYLVGVCVCVCFAISSMVLSCFSVNLINYYHYHKSNYYIYSPGLSLARSYATSAATNIRLFPTASLFASSMEAFSNWAIRL